MITVKGKRGMRYQHMFESNPKWAQHLRLFGEAGKVKVATSTSPTLADCGTQCMMVSYAENQDGDMYRMWNSVTHRVHITHDVIWLKQMMFQQRVAEDHATLPPEVEALIIETPVLVPEVKQEEGPATQQREEADVLDAEDDDDTEEPAVFHATEQTQWVMATTRSGISS